MNGTIAADRWVIPARPGWYAIYDAADQNTLVETEVVAWEWDGHAGMPVIMSPHCVESADESLVRADEFNEACGWEFLAVTRNPDDWCRDYEELRASLTLGRPPVTPVRGGRSMTMHLRYPMPNELVEAGGQPAKSGRRYTSLGRARAVWSYINRWGVQSERYEWRIAEHKDGTFELFRFPRAEPTGYGNL